MKLLLFIGNMYCGGAERVMSLLCNGFVQRGYEVVLAKMLPGESFYLLDKRVKVISLDRSHDATIVQKIRWRLSWYRYIRKVTLSESPDIIITFIYGLNSAVILSTLFGGIPVIASEHTTFDIKLNWLNRFRRFYVNKMADRVTVLTQYDYDYIGRRLKNKIVLPNPLSFNIVDNIIIREKCIIAAGSIDRYTIKGFDNLILIWSRLAPRYPDWILKIAGGGTDENFGYLKEMIMNYGVTDSIRFLNAVENLDLELKKSSIFVLSSRYEGFGMVLIEAMSQGCACVSFDCKSGPRDIIKDNFDGILVENQNIEKMEIAICELMDNDAKRLYIANNAIHSVMRFSKDKILDKWDAIFTELLKR